MIGAGVVVVALIAAGIGAFVVFGGPEEVSKREFAGKACDIQKELSKSIEKLTKDYEDEFTAMINGELDGKRETKQALMAVQALFVLVKSSNEAVLDLVESTIVDDRDGEDYRTDLLEILRDNATEIDDLREELDKINPDDRDAGADLADLWGDAISSGGNNDVGRSSQELAYEIDQKMAEDDDLCSGLTGGDEGGD